MNRPLIFNSPFLLGFEHLEGLAERARTASDGYPPYNIELADDGAKIRIILAVAGFAISDLSIAVEDNQLLIRGRQSEANGKTFLHRGIAARQFLRSFVLAEGIEVCAAALENGLLTIDLVRPRIQPRVRIVEISSGVPT